MALFDNPGKITAVLLADGWHEVYDRSFQIMNTDTEFGFVSRLADGDLSRILMGGLKTQLLAVKRDPRAEGQLERRQVQPDGHWQARMVDGTWRDLWGDA